MSRLLSKKGTRHPHAKKAALCPAPSRLTSKKERLLNRKPSAAPTAPDEPMSPLRPGGALSVESTTAPACSPPNANPWTSRNASTSAGAAKPIRSAPGTSPTAAVATPISSNVTTRMRLRPIRSPKCPKTAAPVGRATKAAPNVANDARRAASGPRLGKKTAGNAKAAAVPYAKKS